VVVFAAVRPLLDAPPVRLLYLRMASECAGNQAEAVIFDMDGVIVDSEPRHERAFLEVVRVIGFEGKHSCALPIRREVR